MHIVECGLGEIVTTVQALFINGIAIDPAVANKIASVPNEKHCK